MMRNRAKLVVLVGVTVATVLGAAATAFASLGKNVTVTGTNSGNVTFVGKIDSVPVTVTCTTFKATGKTGTKAATSFDLSKPPTISGCTDTELGTDTIKTNDTNGKWEFSYASGKVSLTIPKAGATFKSSAVRGCTVTAAPKASAKITGTYDSATGTVTDTNAKIPTSGKGCSSGSSDETATVVLTPNPGKPPWG